MQPSGLKKSMTAIPSSPQACGSDWVSPDDAVGRQNFASTDHAPLSPQSSVASSGSEQTEDQGSARNTFQEDGSGMKGWKPQASLKFSRSESQHPMNHSLTFPVVFFSLINCCRCSCVAEKSPPPQICITFLPDDLRGDDDSYRAAFGVTGLLQPPSFDIQLLGFHFFTPTTTLIIVGNHYILQTG